MCIREYIVYQCAHRSPPVLVTCPLTTEGHANPVCDKRPDRAYYAETCCAACERCVHSRWVIIRENEHRWLHEHGACGCEVVFQGLLNTPRAVGADGVGSGETGGDSLVVAEGSVGSQSSDLGVEVVVKKSKGKERENVPSGTDTTPQGGSSAPPLYRESVAEDGAARVQLRLKSLYAGEWREDHRVLHETGKCNCRASFGAFKPQVPDEELTAEDWKLVQWWREQEDAAESKKLEARPLSGSKSEAEAVLQRIREIERVFGSFEMKTNDEGTSHTAKPNARPGRGSIAIPQPTTTFAESSEQGYRRMGRRRGQIKSQPFFTRRDSQGRDRVRDRSQTSPLDRQSSSTFNQSQRQYTIAPGGQSGYPTQNTSTMPPSTTATQGWIYDPLTNQTTLQYVQPSSIALQSTLPYPTASTHSSSYHQQGPLTTPYPPHLPHPPQVANPAFATMATYTNTIPEGACPWNQPPSQSQSQSQTRSKSGGPYHLLGMDYSSFDNPNHVDPMGTTPICGIPIGGAAHMPPWKDCVQRQPYRPTPRAPSPQQQQQQQLPSIVITLVKAAAAAAPVDTIEYDYDRACDSKSDIAYGAADEVSAVDDDDDEEVDNTTTTARRVIQRRRHSAAL
ncbi:hypothetical protein QBC41DRAFT_364064 [Cercophora samala]|uniref:Uncharacterized protein n=1 Tax=Cercophora samala TaxID=330535 RepID=A0AA39ZGA0_9PEZI|nr:hypothetical protein QBC41DRAFT_364064 [Cercophora samala]